MSESFDGLGLPPKALAAVADLGYQEPTPVQARAIPLVLAGRDLIAAAKTGTGKTAAFSLPLLGKLGRARRGQGPLALVVTPTRELALQIEEVCRAIAKRTGHRVLCLVGGVSYEPQIERLERGCDIVVSTPGRLIDLMNQGAASLNQVETLVLDEADRMLDMGFLPDVRRIVRACPATRQTLLFSATIDAGIQKNMANLLHEPAYVEIAHKGETADLVAQYRMGIDHRMKQDLLHALLEEKGGCRIIVFARTRHRVDACVRKLRRAGYNVAPIHSDRTQNQRKRALDAFAADEVDILVATDVLARGIDIAKVNYVVNFDVPTQAEDYVHRIGRTGRAGERGFAVSFVTPDNQQELRDIEKLIGREIPPMPLPKGFDAGKSDEALAGRANRRAARQNPEIAQAVQEQKARARQEKRRTEREGSDAAPSPKTGKRGKPAPRKTRGTAAKEDKRNQRQAGALKPTRKKNRSGKRAQAAGYEADFRPGRSQRRKQAGGR